MPIDSSVTTSPAETSAPPPPGGSFVMPGPGAAAKGAPPSGNSPWWLLVVAVVVIGGSIAGGYFLAQREGSNEVGSEIGPEVAEVGARAVAAANPHHIDAEEVAAAVVLPPVPEPVEEELQEQLEPASADVNAEEAANTGFDLLVEPSGATISLDGHPIGAAPLRVRNLLPGTHQIDVEGPEGFFGQHQEITLASGEALVLRLALVPLEPNSGTVKSSGRRSKSSPEKKGRLGRRKSERAPSAKEETDLATGESVSLGSLMLGAKPPCEIIINGKNTNLSTPQRAIQLPEGIHRVVLVNEEHGIRKSFKVRIEAGRTTRAIQDLTKAL